MSLLTYSPRLTNYLRRLLMDNQDEISQADAIELAELHAEKGARLEAEVAATGPVLTNEEFQIVSAEAYRASLITPEA